MDVTQAEVLAIGNQIGCLCGFTAGKLRAVERHLGREALLWDPNNGPIGERHRVRMIPASFDLGGHLADLGFRAFREFRNAAWDLISGLSDDKTPRCVSSIAQFIDSFSELFSGHLGMYNG